MIYHYNPLTGTISADQHDYTKPITNPLYNIIITEALALVCNHLPVTISILRETTSAINHKSDITLLITIDLTDIHFTNEKIYAYSMLQRIQHHIDYSGYISLQELIERTETNTKQ